VRTRDQRRLGRKRVGDVGIHMRQHGHGIQRRALPDHGHGVENLEPYGDHLKLQCTTVAQAAGTNTLESTEGKVKGTGAITYSECTVVKPAGKSCLVGNEKMVTTEKLKAGSLSATELKFAPNSGTTFANIKIESCTVAALNNTFPVAGSLIGTVSGATTTTTHAGVTAQATLFFGGNPAGLNGALTIKGPSGAGVTLT
jgi:hypothetical protein